MNELNLRVCEVMDHFCASKSMFANKLGIGLAIVTHIGSGRNKPGVDVLQKIIATYPTLNAKWLLTGEGKMLETAKQNIDLNAELANIDKLVNELKKLKEKSGLVLKYHQIFKEELKYLNELDEIIKQSEIDLSTISEKISAEMVQIKNKVK
jgi:hypothetical protein